MNKYAIIVAAGHGSRMGNDIPKQFLKAGGKTLLQRSLDVFQDSDPDFRIIIAANPGFLGETRNIVQMTRYPANITIVAGGNSRAASVRNALATVTGNGLVFVHDAVRCLLTTTLINRCLVHAQQHGNSVPSIAAVDSVRVMTASGNQPADRNAIRLIQTPQVFYADVLRRAYAAAGNDAYTDDATMVEAAGTAIHLVEGERSNIKITHPYDLIIAESWLASQPEK